MKNEKALAEFMARVAEANTLLGELTSFMENHMETNSDDINWGDVGNAEYIVGQLTELTDWAFKRGEYE